MPDVTPMTITRRSPVSGTMQTMLVRISNRHLLQWQQGEITLATIEPPLTAAERRFLEHGVTPEDDADTSGARLTRSAESVCTHA